MLFSALVGLFGGATSIMAAALAQAPGDNSDEICSIPDTVTTTQTVTTGPEVIVISIINPDSEVSSLVSELTVSSFTTTAPATSDDATTVPASFGTVTHTLTLESVPTNVATATAYGGGFYSISSSTSAPLSDVSSLEPVTPAPAVSSVNAVSGPSTTISTTDTTDVIYITTLHTTVVVTQSGPGNSSVTTFPHSECSPCRSTTSTLVTSTLVTSTLVTSTLVTSTLVTSTLAMSTGNDSCLSTSTDDVTTVTVTEVSTTTTVTKPANTTTVNPANVTAPLTSSMIPSNASVHTTTSVYGTVAATYASSLSVYGSLHKRSVCQLVTATMSDGDVIVFPNAWDGYSYVPTCTMSSLPSSSSALISSSDTVSSSSTVGPVTGTSSPVGTTSTLPTTSSVTSLVSIPTFPSSNVVRSSSAYYASWNTTVTSTATLSFTTSVRPTYSSTSSAAASPTACGEIGAFQITFDDLPINSAFDNDTAPFPPIFQPYHHFQWSFGWTYVPPPTDPFAPQGGERLGMYMNDTANDTFAISPYTSIEGGWFGGGSVAPLSSTAYWFDANDAYVGCDNGPWNNATEDCVVTARGYHYNSVETVEQVADFSWSIPPCETTKNCQLLPIVFDEQFVSLAILSFQAKVGSKEVFLFIDSFVGTWTNNSCAAGLERASTR